MEWSDGTRTFSGFATNTDQENVVVPVAKYALVYMVVGGDFKLPVAYYILQGLNALGRAALTQNVIKHIEKSGAIVKFLTMDGAKSNIAMLKELGADFKENKPFFPSPSNPHVNIFTLLDPPHMLKLARGCLKQQQLYHDGNALKWDFIHSLHKMQQERNLNLCNKLSEKHLNFHVNPMNVRLACETLSDSVATCVDQLRMDGYEQFQQSESTTKYIRYVNNVFDIFNYKPTIKSRGKNFKNALNQSTAKKIFAYLTEAKEFFNSLEIDEISYRKDKNKRKQKQITRKLAIRSRNFTPFLGFVQNSTALEMFYMDSMVNGPLTEFNTFQFSQDHLETWFSAVRSRLGKFNHFLYIWYKMVQICSIFEQICSIMPWIILSMQCLSMSNFIIIFVIFKTKLILFKIF